VKMGWSSSEDLLCVQEDGNVLIYDLFGFSKETVKCLISSVSLPTCEVKSVWTNILMLFVLCR